MCLRSHFTKQGKPKVAYDKPKAQRLAADKGMKAYPCDFCSHWHLATA